MRLTVTGLDATTAPNKFVSLFGRYPYGVLPWNHCQDGWATSVAKDISPTMPDGPVDLKDHLFYLCGVGRKLTARNNREDCQKQTNVHLAVRPRKGSVASIGSVYGVTFIIEDAQAIPIEVLPDDFQGLPREHARCKMFQFGYQMFEVGEIPKTPGEPIHLLRERWREVSGIDHESGYMSKPM